MPIRRAEPSDAEGIAQVLVAAWSSAYRGLLPADVLDRLSVHDSERRWRERIAEPWGHIFVSELRGRIVGVVECGGSQDEDVDQERIGQVYAIYVDPEQWRQGYGMALLSESVNRLRGDGFEEVILWVLRGNQQAIRFYESAGFEADGASKLMQRPDGLELPVVRYRRRIDQAER